MNRRGWDVVWVMVLVILAVGAVASWRTVLFPGPVRPARCWELAFQNGEHTKVCGDHVTTSKPEAGYFTVTVYDESDVVTGTFLWVWQLKLDD